MTVTLAFDVYGTMIDTSGVVTALEEMVGEQANTLSDMWRNKQLEYSFRRGLMQNYRDFSVCTRQALDYVCRVLAVEISSDDKKRLMQTYKVLQPFPDVAEGLSRLKAAGHRLFAFSNGLASDVRSLLINAKIDGYLMDIVSTDEVMSFKPNPSVYAHFLRRSGAAGSEAWMISGNPFDVIGAVSSGMSAAWVKRTPSAVFDPWELEPTITVTGILELHEALS
ncbi:haloacid dehalogenase type II [Thermodesulfobacteriota bacterium]